MISAGSSKRSCKWLSWRKKSEAQSQGLRVGAADFRFFVRVLRGGMWVGIPRNGQIDWRVPALRQAYKSGGESVRDENVKAVATTACRRCRGGYQHSGEHDYRSDYEAGIDDGLQIAAKIAKEIGDGEKNLCENSGEGLGAMHWRTLPIDAPTRY
jgi:hypothetical protein